MNPTGSRREFLQQSLSALPFLLLGSLTTSLSSCSSGPSTSRLKTQAHNIVGRTRAPAGGASRQQLLRDCATLSKRRFPYVFGGESPAEGGMDCSGTIHYLLVGLGYQYPPRQSNHQYLWCKQAGTFQSWSGGNPPRSLRPGDLLFWKNTYKTGKRYPANISHVMIYMGKGKNGEHWQFGGRGSRAKGENGGGIDFHRFNPGQGPFGRGQLVGYAKIPGIRG